MSVNPPSARILISGASLGGNRGAQAMVAAAVHELKNRLVQVEFDLLSYYPHEDRSAETYPGLRIVNCPPLRLAFVAFPLACLYFLLGLLRFPRSWLERCSLLAAFSRADAVVDLSGVSFVGGRGLVLGFNCLSMLVPMLVSTPIVKCAQSMGPFKQWLNRFSAGFFLRRAAGVVARGEATAKHLRDLGIENAEECPDVSFCMPVLPEHEKRAKRAVEGLEPFAVVAPSSVVERYCESIGCDYAGTFADICRSLHERQGLNVLIMPHSARKGVRSSKENDLHVCAKVAAALADCDWCRFLSEPQPAEVMRAILGRARLAIASRFHAMISALASRTPVIVVGWSHKYAESLRYFTLEDWVIDYSNLSASKVAGMVEELMKQRRAIAELYAQHLPEVLDRSRRNFAIVEDVIARARSAVAPARAAQMEDYLGATREAFLGYSADEELRSGAASGGLVTSVLAHLLQTEQIDGALCTRLRVEDGDIRLEAFIARNRNELLSAQGSIYLYHSMTEAFRQLARESGRFAVVGLPCHLRHLERMTRRDPGLAAKVVMRVGIFCGHGNDKRLLSAFLAGKGISPEDIQEFRFRRGHWRGRTRIKLKNGAEKEFPYLDFGVSHNMFFGAKHFCLSCSDHCAESADISCGDAWLRALKSHPIKHSVALVRSERGSEALRDMIEAGKIEGREIPLAQVFMSQRRSLIYKKHIAARARLGKLFGFHVRVSDGLPPRWNDYVSSALIMLGMKASRWPPFLKMAVRLPRFVWYPYLIVTKFFLNF